MFQICIVFYFNIRPSSNIFFSFFFSSSNDISCNSQQEIQWHKSGNESCRSHCSGPWEGHTALNSFIVSFIVGNIEGCGLHRFLNSGV